MLFEAYLSIILGMKLVTLDKSNLYIASFYLTPCNMITLPILVSGTAIGSPGLPWVCGGWGLGQVARVGPGC